MTRSYLHISIYENEITELRKQGKKQKRNMWIVENQTKTITQLHYKIQ